MSKIDKSTKMAIWVLIGLCLFVFAAGWLFGWLCGKTDKPEPDTVWMPRAYYVIVPEAVKDETPKANVVETVNINPEHLGEFKLTAYCTCEKCCGEYADGVTATGAAATVGRTVAVDPDVIPLGSTVYINGFEYIAEDTGGAIEGNRIDVLLPTHEEALQFGVQYADVSIIEKE